MDPHHSHYISPADLAVELDLPTARPILDAIARGELPAIRVGHRTIRIARSDAAAFIDGRRTAPRTAATPTPAA